MYDNVTVSSTLLSPFFAILLCVSLLFLCIGQCPVSPQSQSPLATKEQSLCSVRPKLPRHRPLNRTQSAPLPQSTLAQLVIQQHHILDNRQQKNYDQQVPFSKVCKVCFDQLHQGQHFLFYFFGILHFL